MSVIVHRLSRASVSTAVSEASAWARALRTDLRLTPEETDRLDLCITELVTNALSHGAAGAALPQVELRAELDGNLLKLEIRDNAFAFDPLSMAVVAPLRSLADDREGGFGIKLVRAFADECHYDRRGDENVFTFVLRRPPADNPATPVPRGRERRAASGGIVFPVGRADGTAVHAEGRSGVDRRTLGFISTFRIFKDVAYADVERIVARCALRDFADGEVFLRKGEFNSHVGLVVRGRLRVHLDTPGSRDFFEITPGECVGEMSVIDGRPVSAHAVCEAGCRLLLIDASAFLSEVLTAPGVARNLMAVFAERMRINNHRMVEQMKTAMELERLQRELRYARDIQEAMLPQRFPLFPERLDIFCAARMRAAREVGGDFYDAFFIDSDRLFVAIGDICGKGLPAALLMSRTVTLLRTEATRRGRSQRHFLEGVMERVNRGLCDNNPGSYFATIFAAVFDCATGTLSYVNAGHNPPLLSRSGAPFSFETHPRNPVAGISPERRYRAGHIAFSPGDTLALYTDGVTEAENPRGEQFGEERMIATLDSSRDASSMIDDLFAAVENFTEKHPQSDDITVLVLQARHDAT